MRILIAEDDIHLQSMIERLMQRWKFEFDIVSNGREAIDRAKANEGRYDLCLMDIDMPILNGLEATKVIRHTLRYFPIMALTGNLRAKDEYLSAGMDDYLEKPYSFDNLYRKIKELTVKIYRVIIDGEDFLIKEEMPMDQQHAQEVRELAKNNLRRVKFFDVPGNSLIVHKNVTNKISHDFNVKRQLMTTFINRDPDKPTLCELYKESNYLMPQVYLTEEELPDLLQQEDAELEDYTEPVLKRHEDE